MSFDRRRSSSGAAVMSRIRSGTCLAAIGLFLVLLTPHLDAQETGKKLALLVGVDKYPSGSGFSSLPFPQRDVDQLAKLLLESGYRLEHVRVLLLEKGSK